VNTGTIYKCGPEKTKTEKHRRQARKLTESVEVVNRSLSRSASLSNIEIVVKEGNAGSENDLRESTLIDMIKRKKPVLAHRGVGAHFVEAVGDVGRLVIRQVNLAERVSLVISTAVTMRVVRDVAGQAGHDPRQAPKYSLAQLVEAVAAAHCRKTSPSLVRKSLPCP